MDLLWLPACILFGYAHSLIKLWALVTFWDVGWGSRVLDESDAGPDMGSDISGEGKDGGEEGEEEGGIVKG